MNTPQQILEFVKEHQIRMIDFRFIDFPGIWQHFTIPASELGEHHFTQGLGFDGSSIRGWQPIQDSDMTLLPDPSTAKVDPFMKAPTLVLICDIIDPITKTPYSRDPRNVAKKAEAYLKQSGIADKVFFGPEAEFYIFDDVRFQVTEHSSFYSVNSKEGFWNTGTDEGPNLGYKPRVKEGYFPVPPTDSLHDMRTEMVEEMMKLGLSIECQHHEVGGAGQGEIDMKYDTLTVMADKLMWFKYVVKNVARMHNKTATFMPKPIYQDNGSGMHCHQSLWKGDNPLFAGDHYAGLSEMGLYYIGGIIKHAHALCAFTNPTTNSYHRLIPGYEAPVNLVYASRNRSAAIRLPVHTPSPKSKRVEFRTPDPSCNAYFAFAAMMLAGLDGIKNKIDPGQPLEKNIYELSDTEKAEIPWTPTSLDESLTALKGDSTFLTDSGVFTQDLIDEWIKYKTENELDPIRERPHPYEFHLYFDI